MKSIQMARFARKNIRFPAIFLGDLPRRGLGTKWQLFLSRLGQEILKWSTFVEEIPGWECYRENFAQYLVKVDGWFEAMGGMTDYCSTGGLH
jgi:hypothetical protein